MIINGTEINDDEVDDITDKMKCEICPKLKMVLSPKQECDAITCVEEYLKLQEVDHER